MLRDSAWIQPITENPKSPCQLIAKPLKQSQYRVSAAVFATLLLSSFSLFYHPRSNHRSTKRVADRRNPLREGVFFVSRRVSTVDSARSKIENKSCRFFAQTSHTTFPFKELMWTINCSPRRVSRRVLSVCVVRNHRFVQPGV